MGVAPERVFYLPNCVDDIPLFDVTAVRRKLDISADTPVALLYTRFFEFSQDKLHFLFSEIFRKMPSVRFLVVGSGSNGEESLLEEYCHTHGLGGSLLMAGWLQPAEIPSYLVAADVALYPFSDTLINRSKCPAKLTEIVRLGVPVVADNVGQLAEYIKPGVSGILCEPDNWQDMAAQAVILLKNRPAARMLGDTGRQYILQSFSWRQYAANLELFYRVTVESEEKSHD
jgi:glycosyltransferase involved in cell wall biosynthesis